MEIDLVVIISVILPENVCTSIFSYSIFREEVNEKSDKAYRYDREVVNGQVNVFIRAKKLRCKLFSLRSVDFARN